MFFHKHRIASSSIIALGLIATPVQADSTYQSELSALYSKSSTDDNNEARGLALGLKYNFSEMETAGHPYNEADFFNRPISVEVGLISYDLERESSTLDVDSDSKFIGVMLADRDLPVYVSLDYTQGDIDYENIGDDSIDMEIYSTELGWFVNDELLVAVLYESAKTETSIPSLSIKNDSSEKSSGLALKHVTQLQNNRVLNLELLYKRSRWNYEDKHSSSIDISGNYYFTQSTGLGFRVNNDEDGDTSDTTRTYGLDVMHFFNPSFAIGAKVERSLYEDYSETTTTLVATARM